MATRAFKWDDTGAPTLNGTVGSFYSLMKALLVGTAGVAYGTGPDEKLAAGWTLEWDDSGASKAVFRSPPSLGGSGCYFRVDDSNATYALFQCFESMSDIDTGSAGTGVLRVQKSSAADSTARPWSFIADARTCYGNVFGEDTTVLAPSTPYYGYSTIYGFGDYDPIIPGDPGIFATGRAAADGAQWTILNYLTRAMSPANVSTTTTHHFYTPRSNSLAIAQTRLAIPQSSDIDLGSSSGQWLGATSDGLLGRQWMRAPVAATGCVRGMMRGLYIPLNNLSSTFRVIGDTDTPVGVVSPPTLHVLGAGYQLSFVGVSGGDW